MKKILLGTSGLFGAVALFAGAANAQTPTVTLGGFIDFQAGFVDDDDNNSSRNPAFRNDTEISIKVQGKADNGLGYGAVIDLEADITDDEHNEGENAARTYLYLDSGAGRVELGSNYSASEALRLDASNVARATGGIDGAWSYFVKNTNLGGESFISTPALPVDHGSTTTFGDKSQINSNKISYYSPRVSGLQLGASFTPEANDRGQRITARDGSTASDIYDVALSYEGAWDEASLGIAAAYQGGAGAIGEEDINAWNAGLSLGFSGFTLAGSYGDWDDSLQADGSGDDADYWNIGAGFEFGSVGASVTYFESSYGDNDFENLVFGADYALAPGLTPYVEASLFDFDGAGANDNDGTAVIVGTQLAF